jgi:thiamine biosynthesis protein ThiI
MQCVLIHYGEIGIKKKNRSFFENVLLENIRNSLEGEFSKVYKTRGRVIAIFEKNSSKNKIKGQLLKVPGIAYFSFSQIIEKDIEKIKQKALDYLKEKDFETFKVQTKRSDKKFPLKTPQINAKVGEIICDDLKKKAEMQNPEITLFIEIGEENAFLHTEKIKGIGGLPVRSSGKVLCSLSGGIDSPIAAYMMMKRGTSVIFVHAYNKTFTGEGVLTKIEDLVKELTFYQLKSKLIVLPFEEIQKAIITFVPSSYRMLTYRRILNKILSEIAKKENAKAIVTGDCIAQVASQTLENTLVIQEASSYPILAPLCGMNKEEIVNLAREVGTLEISNRPYYDCCSSIASDSPQTHATLEKTLKAESLIENLAELIKDIIFKAEIKNYKLKKGEVIECKKD